MALARMLLRLCRALPCSNLQQCKTVFAAVGLFGSANLSLYHAKKAMVIESKACCRALFVL
jgi:hypothetical protein